MDTETLSASLIEKPVHFVCNGFFKYCEDYSSTMNLLYHCLLLLLALAAPLAAQADTSMLLVSCEGEGNGADISVNGKLQGQCPPDIKVDAGTLNLRAEADAEQIRKRTENETVQRTLFAQKEQGLEPGKSFKDCPDCPEMVVVPPGSFMMGDPGWQKTFISQAYAVGKFEVTFADWDACVAADGCGGYRPNDQGWGRGKQPVINVSWNDAKQYVQWLSQKTGKTYRLLTEAEWEYAARAGTTTAYSWGDAIGTGNANCVGCGSQWDNKQTAPVGSFQPNAFGLHDMHGNVWEWVEDCYKENCMVRTLRGGSWYFEPQFAHAGKRLSLWPEARYFSLGFRVARVLP